MVVILDSGRHVSECADVEDFFFGPISFEPTGVGVVESVLVAAISRRQTELQ